MKPDRVVIGAPSTPEGDEAFVKIKNLIAEGINVIHTQNASSEMGKLVSNAMLAQRISSMNSLTSFTEKVNECSIDEIKNIVS